MCVDYHAQNKVTIKNKYTIQLDANLFDRFTKVKNFTRLDLRLGYWQVRIVKGDESKTTCVTGYGSYDFLVMPFRLTNASVMFCNSMNDVLFDFLNSFMVVYLDHIIIYSQTLQYHLVHLRKVLQRLRENQLYVNKKKCKFAYIEIKFLRHLVSKKQIRMDGYKVAAIQDWLAPTKVTELRPFLRLANYYKRFIEGFSKIVIHFTKLLKEKREWRLELECQTVFHKLKGAITLEPMLRLPNLNLHFKVQTDASNKALGVVLM